MKTPSVIYYNEQRSPYVALIKQHYSHSHSRPLTLFANHVPISNLTSLDTCTTPLNFTFHSAPYFWSYTHRCTRPVMLQTSQ